MDFLARRQDGGYADPEPLVVSSIWTMWALATVFLVLRWYCRTVRARAVWWDDYILLVGWMFLTAASGTITVLMRKGFGRTLAFHPETHLLSTLTDVLNKCALGLTKTPFAVTLLRVANGWQKGLIWGLVITMNMVLAANAVTTWLAACDRVGKDHYEAVLPGACWNTMDSVIIAMISSSYSAIVDFILAFLPWKIIMSLKMNKREKFGVAVAMSLGCLAGLIGVMKIYKMTTIQSAGDIPYHLSLVFVWGQAEPSATVVASSIPVLRVLCRDIHQSSRYGHSRTRSTGGGGYIRSASDKHASARYASAAGHSKSGSVATTVAGLHYHHHQTASAASAPAPALLTHAHASHSDRSLLARSRRKNDIILTREVQVDVEYQREREGGGGGGGGGDHRSNGSSSSSHHGSCYYYDESIDSSDHADAQSRHSRRPSQGTTRWESFELDCVPPPYPAYTRPPRR